MATIKNKELSQLTAKELEVKVRDLKQEAFNLRLQQATGQLENTDRIRIVRRETARALTFLNAKRSEA